MYLHPQMKRQSIKWIISRSFSPTEAEFVSQMMKKDENDLCALQKYLKLYTGNNAQIMQEH